MTDTLLCMMFSWAGKRGNICCGHKIFLEEIRNIFCVSNTNFVSATNVARAGKQGNICVRNNESSFATSFVEMFEKVNFMSFFSPIRIKNESMQPESGGGKRAQLKYRSAIS